MGTQIIKLLTLSKICQSLRDIGSQINRVNVNCNYPAEVEKLCKFYFNSFSLFFPESCNSTVWNLGYTLPFHANKVYTDLEDICQLCIDSKIITTCVELGELTDEFFKF